MTNYIRKSKIREATNLNVGQEVYDKLNDEVEYHLEMAEKRAEGNGRRTIKARDV